MYWAHTPPNQIGYTTGHRVGREKLSTELIAKVLI